MKAYKLDCHTYEINVYKDHQNGEDVVEMDLSSYNHVTNNNLEGFIALIPKNKAIQLSKDIMQIAMKL